MAMFGKVDKPLKVDKNSKPLKKDVPMKMDQPDCPGKMVSPKKLKRNRKKRIVNGEPKCN